VLCNEFGYVNRKVADDLKSLVKLLFGFSEGQVESDEKDMIDERWGLTPRRTLQFFGTEVMQYKIQELLPDVGRKFWIQSFINKYIMQQNDMVVVSDLRLLHEFEELSKHGLFVIRVDRTDYCSSREQDEHISEKEYLQIPANVVFDNNGSIEDLRFKVKTYFNQI